MDRASEVGDSTEVPTRDIWCCPACKAGLDHGAEFVDCRGCGQRYPVIGGVLDLRIDALCPFDLAEDRRRVTAFAKDVEGLDAAGIVRRIYGRRPGWSDDRIEFRTGQVMQFPDLLADEISGWLREIVFQDLPFLDLGSAHGMLLIAAAREGRIGVGVDLSLDWLLAAQRRILDEGGLPVLAAASGEALPLRDGAIGGVAGLDVIEHVSDVGKVLAEADRVLRPGGALVLTTPNRFSLVSEPHVFIWGVGWLPYRWQERYVKWRSGLSYGRTRLMSSWSLLRMVRDHTRLKARIHIPQVRAVHTRHSTLRDLLIPLYNGMAKHRFMRPVFLLCGPFFRLWAWKPAAVETCSRAASE